MLVLYGVGQLNECSSALMSKLLKFVESQLLFCEQQLSKLIVPLVCCCQFPVVIPRSHYFSSNLHLDGEKYLKIYPAFC
jgi:hypothetical protein